MTANALRIIGFGYKEYKYREDVGVEEIENNLIFAGFLRLMGPPRKEVKKAVKKYLDGE